MDVAAELLQADLGDQRLNRRFCKIVDALTEAGAASIPQATRHDSNLVYRFFRNVLVDLAELRRAHFADTAQRLLGQHLVLLTSDTTFVDYSGHRAVEGLGYWNRPDQKGLCLHSTLALTAQGLPLGLVQQYSWCRDPAHFGKRQQRRGKDTADKESQRWLDALDDSQHWLAPGQKALFIADREGDFYDLLAAPRRPGVDILVRAKSRRALADEDALLGAAVGTAPVCGSKTVTLYDEQGRKKRQATVVIRYRRCRLRPPATHPQRRHLQPLPITVIEVVEANPPPGAEPARWLLLTSCRVRSAPQAKKLVGYYALRWRCEGFHSILKGGGCRVEQLQLERRERLEKAIAVYSIVAMRIMRLQYRARDEPEAASEEEFTTLELEVLRQHMQAERREVVGSLKLRDAVRAIAQLGGFLGRKGDGEPGAQTLWKGIRRLMDLVEGYQLAQQRSTLTHGPPTTVQSSD
jgi:hypothetical protein